MDDLEKEPTKKAIKIAEIITCGSYRDTRRYNTLYGKKSIKGIARIIDNIMNETGKGVYNE